MSNEKGYIFRYLNYIFITTDHLLHFFPLFLKNKFVEYEHILSENERIVLCVIMYLYVNWQSSSMEEFIFLEYRLNLDGKQVFEEDHILCKFSFSRHLYSNQVGKEFPFSVTHGICKCILKNTVPYGGRQQSRGSFNT